MPETAVFAVTGMSCAHCVAAVEAEVRALPGVLAARADLATGRLEVEAEAPLAPSAVVAAVAEAGYEVAP